MLNIEQKKPQVMVYKIHSRRIKNAKYNLVLPLKEAINNNDDVVSLADSQCMRWLHELNNVRDLDIKIKEIRKQIRRIKKQEKSRQNSASIRMLYDCLYQLQYQQDYLLIIMDSDSDYDRLCDKCIVNGVEYVRLLGTSGGVKKSTIVFINKDKHDIIQQRIDNGRDKTKPIIPAKLEAYQGLVCSASIPLPEPKGFIVVQDCITHFTDDVITLNDEADGEPVMEYVDGYEIEHNDSDGYGFMSPEYSKKVNGYLNGDYEHIIAAMNTRYAFEKGICATFDYVDFAENVAGTYYIKDAWGDIRDVREADIILTTSMLKLWDSYSCWEEYYENCKKNHYEFSATKTSPAELEKVRTTNYQFLQSYDFTDEEIYELCKPTIDEINDVLGMDYRRTLAYLTGDSMSIRLLSKTDNNFIKALMIDKEMINDPFVRKRVHAMIEKQIERAKKGTILVNGNYAIITGDLYALAQSMFGLEVTGLLKRGEIYHKTWIDKGSDEVVCFRAPMTCHNNIRKVKVVHNEEMDYWYKYADTVMVMNAWDTICDAMNGSDKDGDTSMTTDNEIIRRRTLNSKTIMCMQRKGNKIIPTEEDMVHANKLGFNDDIGTVTNRITAMIDVQAQFIKDSEEYDILDYRIKCGQLLQQNSIDRIKGIVAKPMPEHWYNRRACVPKEYDDEQTTLWKENNLRIVADKKPYFMIYIYPELRKEYKKYQEGAEFKCMVLYGMHLNELINKPDKTDEQNEFLRFYWQKLPVGYHPCVINKICWLFENEFDGYIKKTIPKLDFDYTIMKSGVKYTNYTYQKILNIYKEYQRELRDAAVSANKHRLDKEEVIRRKDDAADRFMMECYKACNNADMICDIVLDICYTNESSKQFAWDVCGDVIIKNLLERNNGVISYPVPIDTDGEFSVNGQEYIMESCKYESEDNE